MAQWFAIFPKGISISILEFMQKSGLLFPLWSELKQLTFFPIHLYILIFLITGMNQMHFPDLKFSEYQSEHFQQKKPLTIAAFKVHIFWEGHQVLRNLHLTFVLCSASQK